VADDDLSFFVRLWLALTIALRIIVDAALAQRVKSVSEAGPPPALPPGPSPAPKEAAAEPKPGAAERDAADEAALGVLALLQREGRLVDFLEQDIATFVDAEIGAAARVVHEGCRRALRAHLQIVRVRDEREGSTVTLAEGFDAASVKLTGDVRGSAPYRGVLRHSGWRVRQIRLPERVAGHDATVLAPAEVEL
jgi:hypothetical protein